MKLNKRITFLFALICLPLLLVNGQNILNHIEWKVLPDLPPATGLKNQPGLAAPFAGVSNGVLLVAGGCNFPQEPVWEGGKKAYYKDAFALELISDGLYKWHSGFQIPAEVAYGVSIDLPEGVLCIGGKNNDTEFSNVFLMNWDTDKESLLLEEYPALPFPVNQAAGTLLDDKIYIAGGIVDGKASNIFLSLDLSKKGSHDFSWEIMPDFPGPARVQPVATGQNAAEEKHFYLFSGSSYPASEENPIILTDALEFNPKTNEWTALGPITPKGSDPISLHGAFGIPSGSKHILFTGGVNRDIFYLAWKRDRLIQQAREINDTANLRRLNQEKLEYFLMNPGKYRFNNKVLAYHTITQTWTEVEDYPFPGPAGAPMVKWGEGFVVINGEIKPGVRSPKLYYGTIEYEPTFGWINWSVIAIYLFIMLYVGYYFMKREDDTNTFFKGGQRVPWWAAGMSIFATMLSAITYMAIPAKTYATDWRYFMMAITILLLVYPVVHFYLPFFRRLNVTTAYEYLEKRFNYTTRFMASAVFMVFMVARMALVLFLPSLALTTVTGIDIYLCIILMGVITIIYCTMGGVEAVIWGDVIQGFVLLGGAILAVIFMVMGTEGGIGTVIEITIDHEKMKTFDFAFDVTRATFWVVLLGGIGNNLISYSSDQAVIQRYLTTKDEKGAAKGLWFNGIMSIIISLIFYFIGTTLFAYYKTQPQELNVIMENTDSIFPHFIMSKMPIGIAGLMIAAIFSATMSTVSSNVNSISTSFTVDFYDHFKKGASERIRLRIARITGIIAGGIGILLALLMATWNILSLLDYFNTILGLLAGGLGGLFAMGIFFPRIGSKAAITGFLMSFILLLYLRSFTEVSFLLYGFIGILSSIVIAYVVSWAFVSNKRDLKGLTLKSLND